MAQVEFLKKVLAHREALQMSRLRRSTAHEVSGGQRYERLGKTPIQRVIKREIERQEPPIKAPAPRPSPVELLELISPAYHMYKRSISPVGAAVTLLSPEPVQKERLIDFAGEIGAVTPEGQITPTGRDIMIIGQTAEKAAEIGGAAAGVLGKISAIGVPGIIAIGAIAYILLKR